jgi:hypothetical protein
MDAKECLHLAEHKAPRISLEFQGSFADSLHHSTLAPTPLIIPQGAIQ